jgi:hypothetical protein
LCSAGIQDLSVSWARSFKVSNGLYSAVGYVQNKNADAAIQKVSYTFKIYDDKGVLIQKREGSTFVYPGERFVLFEPRIHTGYRIPDHTFLEFQKDPVWKKVNKQAPKIIVKDRTLTDVNSSPRLSATLSNPQLTDIKNIQVVAIVYNTKGNAIGSSSTYIDRFPRTSDKTVNFIWPEPFSGKVSRIEIIPRDDVFDVTPS